MTRADTPLRGAASVACALAVALWVAGCALSPQTVSVNPAMQAAPKTAGNGRTVALSVRDERANRSFGTRGGLYDATSFVDPDGEIAAPVRAALAGRLAQAGYVVQPAGAPGDLGMEVIVRDIAYSGSGTPTVTQVDVSAAIDVLVSAGERSYRGQSKVSDSHQVVTAPNADQNERYINDVLGRALDRVLANPELNRFLAQ